MNDLLGFGICERVEKVDLDNLEVLFNPSEFNLEWDDRTSFLFAAFMSFYAVKVMKLRKDLIIDVLSPGGRMFLIARPKDEEVYANIKGIRHLFVGAVLNEDDRVMIIYANEATGTLFVEYRPLLAIATMCETNSLRYCFEKQYAYNFLEEVLNDDSVKGWELMLPANTGLSSNKAVLTDVIT